jgi:PAS domain S-box-containing protein
VNTAAIELYGYSEAEFLAMTVDTLVPGGEAPRQLEDFGKPVMERHLRKSGRTIYAEVRIREMQFDSKPAWLVLSIDITERKTL